MTEWTTEQLTAIGGADELHVASYRRDGTLRPYVTIWVVRSDDALYIRSANGKEAGWYRHAQATHVGRIRAGGVEVDVTFVDVDPAPALTAALQNEYHRKYDHYGEAITSGALSLTAQQATYRIAPRRPE